MSSETWWLLSVHQSDRPSISCSFCNDFNVLSRNQSLAHFMMNHRKAVFFVLVCLINNFWYYWLSNCFKLLLNYVLSLWEKSNVCSVNVCFDHSHLWVYLSWPFRTIQTSTDSRTSPVRPENHLRPFKTSFITLSRNLQSSSGFRF